MKRFIACVLALLILCSSALAEGFAPAADNDMASAVLGKATKLKKQSVKSQYATWDNLGVEAEVLAAWKANEGYSFLIQVNYGADFYENPAMAVYVGMDKNAVITGVKIADSFEHTAAFVGMVNEEYLAAHYAGQNASATFVTDAVTGATYSSDTVLYAVRLASYYAAQVFKIGKVETVSIQMKKLMAAVPGSYTEIAVDPSFTSAHGEVQYAATGVTEDGRSFTALIVQSLFVPENPENDMAMPAYQLWIDNATSTVFNANMLSGRFYEGYEMPADKLALYNEIPMTSANVFDDLMDVLVTDAPENILTSASKTFTDTVTGATAVGNDTSRAVKDCFICAAEYYCAMAK